MCKRECVYVCVCVCVRERERERERQRARETDRVCVRDFNTGGGITVVMVGFHDLETGEVPTSFHDSKLNKIVHYKISFYLREIGNPHS